MKLLTLLAVFIGMAMLVLKIPVTLFNARFILLFFIAIYFSTRYNVLLKGSQGQIWSAPSNITANITFQIPPSQSAVCPMRILGVVMNSTWCYNSTGQLRIRGGTFPIAT